MTNANASQPYSLGLDLGVASIGWAMVADSRDEDRPEPRHIIRTGVHLFEAGVDGGKQGPEAALESGKESSRATPRRDARQQRRQTWRRAYRKQLALKRLIRHRLLPKPKQRINDPAEIDAYLKSLDAELRAKWEQNADHARKQLLPYRLRAKAIHERLELSEVGRALYHLTQRRGFLSNRKTDDDSATEDDESTGKVKKGISELEQLMKKAGAETLGEYFASLDPTDPETRRIRGRYTHRAMYEHEFERIWTEQSRHHPEQMTDEAQSDIRYALFYQRPLKSQRHLIGKCSLVEGKRRVPIADRLFQRFRILQKVNDLEIIPHMQIDEEDVDKKTGEVKINPKTGEPKMKKRWVPDPQGIKRKLTAEKREEALHLLAEGDATFTQLRKAGVAPNECRFNFETDGEKKLPGLRTDERLREVFGGQWDEFSEEEKNGAVEDCLSFVRTEAMKTRGRVHWGLTADQAHEFTRVKLEEGYGRFSRAAIRKLMPHLENGVRLQAARKQLFPESFASREPVDTLPPLTETFDEPLSPAVSRALSELRGVVNAIIRRYGKPTHVRIESPAS